jgi:hypothetical protein
MVTSTGLAAQKFPAPEVRKKVAHGETPILLRFTLPGCSLESARGLAQSKTLSAFPGSSCRAQRLGLRRPYAAFSNSPARATDRKHGCGNTDDGIHGDSRPKPIHGRTNAEK